MTFREELETQRWDDHRLYHQSRVNQTLHLFSACTFLVCYALIPFHPLAASVLGWVVAMWGRQIGHFFFEPRGFDTVNQMGFDEKESVKVGFNLYRKILLLCAWGAVPVALWVSPDLGGLLPPAGPGDLADRVGWAWIGVAGAGLLARTGWLMVTRSPQTGAAWFTKILTDPVHDIQMYWSAPLWLARGQWIDPMDHVKHPAGR